MLVLDFVKCLVKEHRHDILPLAKVHNNINKIVTNDVNVKLKGRTSWNQRGGFMEIGCKGQRKLMGSLKNKLKNLVTQS